MGQLIMRKNCEIMEIFTKRYVDKQKMKKQQQIQRQSDEENIEKSSTLTKTKKNKINNLQALFTKVSKIVHELWLEQNTDRHNPAKGQLRVAK